MKSSHNKREETDFREFGYRTMLECREDEEHARQICANRLKRYELGITPDIATLQSQIAQYRNQGAALHSHLYDRPEPVDDARMLTHRKKIRIFAVMACLAAIACFTGNTTTAYLFGYGLVLTLILAIGATGLPLVIGHFAYERIIERHRTIQAAIIAVVVVLGFAGIYELAEARQLMVSRAAAETSSAPSSYVDGAEPGADASGQDDHSGDDLENRVRERLSSAMLLIMLAADLMLGYVTGLLVKMHTDEDYAAWRRLQKIAGLITGIEEQMSRLLASIEIAKRQCAEGILCALVALRRRKPTYHRPLMTTLLLAALSAASAQAQTIERYEGILIDTSGSISRNGTTNELFREYLVSTKKLLTTETPSTRVWVSGIAMDSFGSDGTILKGWTPEARGIFTDNLNRARRELASAFEQKSSGMKPVAAGTDIFGALWREKALFEPVGRPDAAQPAEKTIWIFSDMKNESAAFEMPALLPLGPEQMLERAKANRLIVPMEGYKVYVYGASPNGLSPEEWLTIKRFWTIYFQAAGAELVTYSAESQVQR
jgi:hypothetical protein